MISEVMKVQVNNNSTIRAMFEEGKRLSQIYGEDNVYDFSIGNPSVDTPKEIKIIIDDILNSESPISVHGYMNNSGYENVRQDIANHLNSNSNLSFDYKNIVMTCGAAGGLNILLKTLLNIDDEVIIIAPFFGEYINYVKNYGGKIVKVNSYERTFQIDLEDLKEKITTKTKAVIINSPNNPTGVIYSTDTIVGLTNILSEKQIEFSNQIYLISDEPYRELVYENVTMPNILEYYNNAFVGYSYSKSLSLPGERIGYIVINPKIYEFDQVISALNIANRILGFVNAPSLFQKVISRALDIEIDINLYKKNRDYIYQALVSLGLECVKPEGAFYLFPKCPIDDDIKFCEDAKRFNILLVPGSVFGLKGHFRLSYCVPYEKIVNSIPAFKKLLEIY